MHLFEWNHKFQAPQFNVVLKHAKDQYYVFQTSGRTINLMRFVEDRFPGCVLKDSHPGLLLYQISSANTSLAKVSQLFIFLLSFVKPSFRKTKTGFEYLKGYNYKPKLGHCPWQSCFMEIVRVMNSRSNILTTNKYKHLTYMQATFENVRRKCPRFIVKGINSLMIFQNGLRNYTVNLWIAHSNNKCLFLLKIEITVIVENLSL